MKILSPGLSLQQSPCSPNHRHTLHESHNTQLKSQLIHKPQHTTPPRQYNSHLLENTCSLSQSCQFVTQQLHLARVHMETNSIHTTPTHRLNTHAKHVRRHTPDCIMHWRQNCAGKTSLAHCSSHMGSSHIGSSHTTHHSAHSSAVSQHITSQHTPLHLHNTLYNLYYVILTRCRQNNPAHSSSDTTHITLCRSDITQLTPLTDTQHTTTHHNNTTTQNTTQHTPLHDYNTFYKLCYVILTRCRQNNPAHSSSDTSSSDTTHNPRCSSHTTQPTSHFTDSQHITTQYTPINPHNTLYNLCYVMSTTTPSRGMSTTL
jgi:hypothetical protein